MTNSRYFKITTCINCPQYSAGDKLAISNSALTLPLGKSACLILVRNITELLFLLKDNQPDPTASQIYSCSGCQGLIKFQETEAFEIVSRSPDQQDVGFRGYIQELPPEELMQTINMNQKTGTLFFDFSADSASISFNNGQIVHAAYSGKEDAEAFFSILQEKEGSFQFSKNLSPSISENDPIGDFMGLLMEGLQRIDEQEEKEKEESKDELESVSGQESSGYSSILDGLMD